MPWHSNYIAALLLIYGFAQFVFHLFVPLMLRGSGATAMKLSLLTADFYLSVMQVILLQNNVGCLNKKLINNNCFDILAHYTYYKNKFEPLLFRSCFTFNV